MALEASHIRFALDIKEKLRIRDLKRYLSGIIYPDSRYVTKIERELTHPLELLDTGYTTLDDFNKGCYAHLLYDNVLRNYTKETVPELFSDIGNFSDSGRELWLRMTVLKIFQDIDDIKNFDIKAYLPVLEYINNPNGEDLNKLMIYNKYFQNMYADPESVTLENYYEMWRFLGIGNILVNRLKIQTKKYLHNETVKKFIKTVYRETLKRWNP